MTAGSAWSGIAGRREATRSRHSSGATTSRIGGSISSETTKRGKIHERAQAAATDLPLVLIPDREPLRAPSTLDLARALDLRTSAEKPLYDLCIVGAGPAGLAAAVYGASEGLGTVVVEGHAPGGQAGQSAAHRELPRLP